MNKNLNKRVDNERNSKLKELGNRLPKKIMTINIQENSNTQYSDKKMKAKLAPEYSVLNPETNSDSDSLKSNGAR